MHYTLFLDFLPDDLSSLLILAGALFLIAIFWSFRTNKGRKNRKRKSFKDSYYEKRKDNE